jgi:UDP-N-acetylglucosamine--dolichyl-phosphate N-acetylglucosaminephosphotransferase
MIAFLVSVVVTFFVSLYLIKKFIPFFLGIGFVGKDIHKEDDVYVAEMGGFPVVISFIFGILTFIGINTFYTGYVIELVFLLGAVLTIIIVMFIGMIDDMTSLFKRNLSERDPLKKHKRVGLKQHHKFLLPIFAAVPLMVLHIGDTTMNLPFFGMVDFGLLYPLVIVPLAIFGASNATNMLAGLNGLESGLGVVLIFFLGLFSILKGSFIAGVIAFIFVSALFAFFIYNIFPAKIFPGDSLTYTIGAVAAVVAILGGVQKFAVFCFVLWFIELFLKARSKFKAESFGVRLENGVLKNRYNKYYSLVHIVMDIFDFKERTIVFVLITLQIIICSISFVVFF